MITVPINRFYVTVILTAMAILLVWVGYFTQRSETIQLFLCMACLFVGYIWLCQKSTDTDISWLLYVSIGLRLILLFQLPNLSDDYFRFIWDGRLLINGGAPFAYLPREINSTSLASEAHLTPELFNGLNSPDYYTIYPPVLQAIFGLSALMGSNSIFGGVVVLRLFIFFAEIGTLVFGQRLLIHLNLPRRSILLYALNPLVIIELTGNLHFEATLLFFLVAALYFLNQQKLVLSALFFALAVCSKLIPLLFLPLFIGMLGWRRFLYYGFIVGSITILLFLPLLYGGLIGHLTESVGLYMQKFEFNASIYYIIRWIGFQIKGYNIIQQAGPLLWLMITILVLIIALYRPARNLPELFRKMTWALLIYYALSSIVHPWYIAPLVLFSVFTRIRFPLFWSGLIFFSYSTYQTPAYTENLWLTAAAYLGVAVVLSLDLRRKKSASGILNA